jgi:hypothetical protein
MLRSSDYQLRRAGPWDLLVLPDRWSEQLQESVMNRIREREASKHPQTIPFDVSGPHAQKRYFIKLFHCNGIGDALKNLFRASKPKRFGGKDLPFRQQVSVFRPSSRLVNCVSLEFFEWDLF